MIGNVREWCKDWYGPYADESATDPLGPALGVGRVSRGGSWYIDAGSCRSATRAGLTRDYDDDYLGLRLARTITVQSIQPVSRKSMARVRAIGLDGHITAVDMKNKLAEISIGAAVGVKQAMELHVTRGDEYVAQITIVDVLPDKAIGIVEGVQPGMQPRAGDRITGDLR